VRHGSWLLTNASRAAVTSTIAARVSCAKRSEAVYEETVGEISKLDRTQCPT
jgi:hypothetical protein